jgi:hypothetical protein
VTRLAAEEQVDEKRHSDSVSVKKLRLGAVLLYELSKVAVNRDSKHHCKTMFHHNLRSYHEYSYEAILTSQQ